MTKNDRRRHIERRIVNRLLTDAIGAGYAVSVNDGQEVVVRESVQVKVIMAAMFSVDDEYLLFRKDGKLVGWARLIYGNSGWDVIADHSTDLEPVMRGANILADRLSR